MTHQQRTRAPNGKRRARAKPLMPMDQEILRFLWKWKLSTALVLYFSVGKLGSRRAFNKRLTKLEENGVIEMNYDYCNRGRKLWELTSLGFQQIKSTLPELKDTGIKSPSLDHDFTCLAFILGEWAFEKCPLPEIITDQELLRIDDSERPDWLPAPRDHRADGFIRVCVDGEEKVFAFEAELNVKRSWRYEVAIWDYRHQRRTTRVIWLYRDPYFLTQFLKAKAERKDETANYHVFVDEADFLENGWEAAVYNEKSVKLLTLRKLLRGNEGVDPGETAGKGGRNLRIKIFSDRKKYLDLKPTCEFTKEDLFL